MMMKILIIQKNKKFKRNYIQFLIFKIIDKFTFLISLLFYL